MAEAPTKAKAKKVFDIAKPNATPANPTSKPIIVGHGSLMRDPTLTAEATEQSTGEEEPLKQPMSGHGLTIKPLNDVIVAESSKAKSDQPPEVKAEPASEEKSEPEATPTAPTASATPSTTNIPAKDETSETKPEEANQDAIDQEAAAKALKKQQEIDALITSGKYFLPINRKEKRHNRRIALLGVVVIVILAVAWVDVALDAGIIHLAYQLPHTHWFASRH